MKRNLLIRMAVPITAALFVVGCSTSHHKASYQPARGAPAVPQTTEVVSATGGVETANQGEIQLHKEEMVVGKRQTSNGGVLVRTVVQTENVSQPIELNREEYVIERVPASEVKGTETAFQGREIYIPLTREEPLTSKRALVTEKVQITKRIETDKQTVSTPVRSEDVVITKTPAKATGTVWQQAAPTSPAAAADTNSLKLFREEMIVGKTVVDNGGVKLQKIVRTETASQPVELQREEFAVNRTPVEGAQVASTDFAQREIRLNLSREEPTVATKILPTEWVRVSKKVHTDTQTVTGTIRKENVEIVKLTGEQPAMGGTSAADLGGTTTMSESGSAQIITIKGNAYCAKCQLHEAANCQGVIQVKNGKTPMNYYLVQHDVNNLVMDAETFHEDVCKQGKKVTATGSVRKVDGKMAFTPSKITVID